MATNRHTPSVAGIKLTAVAAVLVGGMVLLGWAFDFAALKSISPDWVSMKANTALCFILTGIALGLIAFAPGTANRQRSMLRFARFMGLPVGLIGAFTLGEYVFGWNPGLDQWLIVEPSGAVGTSYPGRMAPDTALSFVLLSVALWLAGSARINRWNILAQVSLGLLAALLALATLLSYLTPDLGAYGWFGLTLMAAHTALLFVLLGMAVMTSRMSCRGRSADAPRRRWPAAWRCCCLSVSAPAAANSG